MLIDDDDGVLFSANVGGTTFTGGEADSLFDFGSLAAGNYTLGLTAFDNDPIGSTLGDGYSERWQPPVISSARTSASICSGSARS